MITIGRFTVPAAGAVVGAGAAATASGADGLAATALGGRAFPPTTAGRPVRRSPLPSAHAHTADPRRRRRRARGRHVVARSRSDGRHARAGHGGEVPHRPSRVDDPLRDLRDLPLPLPRPREGAGGQPERPAPHRPPAPGRPEPERGRGRPAAPRGDGAAAGFARGHLPGVERREHDPGSRRPVGQAADADVDARAAGDGAKR